MSKTNLNILITICARGGSKGVKDKNIRLLADKPLISYTVRQAVQWGKASHIVVSTDVKQIAAVAQKYGAEVPFMRPKRLATDTAGKLPVIRHALAESERTYKTKFQIIVDLDPTSPVRTLKDLDNALHIFMKTGADTIFSVTPAHKSPYFNMVERNSLGVIGISKIPSRPVLRRQDAPKVYDMNASMYIYKREYLAKKTSRTPISRNSEIYCMSEWSSIDIDREIDFRYVEFLLKEHIITL